MHDKIFQNILLKKNNLIIMIYFQFFTWFLNLENLHFPFFSWKALEMRASNLIRGKKWEIFQFHLLPCIVEKIRYVCLLIAGRFCRQFVGRLQPEDFHGIFLVSGESPLRERRSRDSNEKPERGFLRGGRRPIEYMRVDHLWKGTDIKVA